MHRTMLSITTVILVFIGVAYAIEERRPGPFAGRMRYLIAWIAARSDYSSDVSLPRVKFLPREQIQYLYYPNPERDWQRDVYAVYDGWRQLIILPTSFDIRWEESILVHELVHHLQNVHRRRFGCPEEQEREAYLIQRQYVEETGIGPMPDWAFIASLRCTYQ